MAATQQCLRRRCWSPGSVQRVGRLSQALWSCRCQPRPSAWASRRALPVCHRSRRNPAGRTRVRRQRSCNFQAGKLWDNDSAQRWFNAGTAERHAANADRAQPVTDTHRLNRERNAIDAHLERVIVGHFRIVGVNMQQKMRQSNHKNIGFVRTAISTFPCESHDHSVRHSCWRSR